MSHINNPSSSIDSNEAALLTSLEALASGTGQAIVKTGSTTLGLVTFGDLTKALADTYYEPLGGGGSGSGEIEDFGFRMTGSEVHNLGLRV